MENDALTMIDVYAKEIEDDTTIDIINVAEKQKSELFVKNKWLYRAIQAAKKRIFLERQKEDLIQKKFSDNVLNLSKVSIKNKAEQDSDIIRLSRLIEDQQLLVTYLDKAVDKIFTYSGKYFETFEKFLKREEIL